MTLFEESMKKAMEEQDPDSMGLVGQCYLLGDGVDQDLEKARQWLLKAASAGSDYAMLRLAEAYMPGAELKEDTATAEKYAKQCYNKKNAESGVRGWAAFLMARFWIDGLNHTPVSLDMALQLMDTAKSLKCPIPLDSTYDKIYKLKDYARKRFTEDLKRPHSPEGHYNRGLYFMKGDGGYNTYYEEAFEEFKIAAKHGHAEAQLALCKAYHEGQGVKKDQRLAEKWCKKAIKSGASDAKYYLSMMNDTDFNGF